MNDADRASLRAAYERFLKPGRVLLTGHSHQAWPDVLEAAMTRFFDDSAELVDDKWERAVFPKLEAVGRAVLARMGFDEDDDIAFGKSTHELTSRLLSCFRLADRPRIVTTRGEFHSLHRQLARLAEEGAEVVWVDSHPRATLADRVIEAIDARTTVVALSAVMFEDAFVVPKLGAIGARAAEVGAVALIDAYHAFNVVPLDFGDAKETLFVTAGGYKYAAMGEGLCWLRIPRGTTLRPLDTGWFADFASLADPRPASGPMAKVSYGPGGARFTGSTFDPTSVYRAEAALAHWDRFGLTPAALRAISLAQTSLILEKLDAAGLGDRVLTPREPERRGGFIAVRVRGASEVVARLRAQDIFTDARGEGFRLGPAPYLTDEEIEQGVAAATSAIRAVDPR